MKLLAAIFAVVLMLAEAPAPTAAIPYFSNMRDVTVTTSDKQNYVTVDEQVWKYARHDLEDLRLHAEPPDEASIAYYVLPYALAVMRASSNPAQQTAKVLDLGTVNGATQFLIDTAGVPEYDRVTLDLSKDARDFIARATVAGSDSDADRNSPWTRLGTFTLYDFSREKLGSNSTLKLPLSRFRYLRIAIPELKPEQIAGARIAMVQEQKASWTELSAQPRIEQVGKTTVITWEANENVPLERIAFTLDPSEVNFRRPVEVATKQRDQDTGREAVVTLANSAISRVHIVRGGRVADSEELNIDFSARASNYRVTIQNGDDPPLRIAKVQPLVMERRVYFDPKGRSALRLYYGDPKLGAPSYDYAKFFQADPVAARAQLGPDAHNAAYTGRPDERPWSEKHRWVMWAALVIAVVALGSVAFRGLKTS